MKKHIGSGPVFERSVSDTLSMNTRVDTRKNQVDFTGNWGFFSNCTITLWALIKAYPTERFIRVNWPYQDNWRDKDQVGKNLFDLYFDQSNKTLTGHLTKVPPVDPHGIYSDLPFGKLLPYVEKYFAPSAPVRKIWEKLFHKYSIDYEKTVAVLYRGTNQWEAVASIPPHYFIQEAKRLVANDSKLRVLVQTDQEQVRDLCLEQLGKRAFCISEMPVTSSLVGLHRMSPRSRKNSNFEFGMTLLAVVNLIAKCRYLVTSTSNVGFWACLYRGNTKNTCQLRPRPPDFISDYVNEPTNKGTNVRNLAYISSLEDELHELRSENVHVWSYLNAVRSDNVRISSQLSSIRNSVMYKTMRLLASRIDALFPDEFRREEARKRISKKIRDRSSR